MPIKVLPPKNCTGCGACYSVCPQKCISLETDSEGFSYPKIDREKCTKCCLCEKVCPAIHGEAPRNPIDSYVAQNTNEDIRLNSSSGGIFSLLAEKIIDEGGVVFGARFDTNWQVIHDYTETKEGIAAFRRSKYVQSEMDDCFLKASNFLKEGRKVLFSGTPCQIIGLKRFLRKDYENLFTIDFICHGVPSAMIWDIYLSEEMSPLSKQLINEVNFRSKITGWKDYSLNISFVSNNKVKQDSRRYGMWDNTYMKGFLSNLYLRPSCHDCPVRDFKSQSDITLADAWGFQQHLPEWDDDKGTSMLLIFTKKGERLIETTTGIIKKKIDYSIVFKHNDAVSVNPKQHKNRKKFFELIQKKKKNFSSIIDYCLPKDTYWDKVIWSINKRIKKYV